MRRITWAAAILLVFSLVLSACGTKDAESVVKELDKTVSSMESYRGSGTMTLNTGTQPLQYAVEVSYQKPNFYRIKLTNTEKDITQIVLRNDDGVFVLTPRLNKVFRFQSDWPQNQGQVYLYQTLVQSILLDNSRQFAVEDNSYVFDVMANYNNGSLARQKIWLNKSDFKPVHVEVSDTNASVMVDVKFDTFEFGPKFESSAFETEANMKSAPSNGGTGDQATTVEPDDNGENSEQVNTPSDNSSNAGTKAGGEASNGSEKDPAAGKADNANTTGGKTEEETDETIAQPNEAGAILQVMLPTYMPQGVSEKDSVDIVFGGNAGLMTRYTGTYDYSIIQTQPKDQAASYSGGEMFDLGFTIGQISNGEEQRTLTWLYEGNQFRLTSSTLSDKELTKIAQSVQADTSK
ncbi:LolA family protein [Paenibacillus gorillae]|uniref:LolA family protein n=1 Tax=Paenibacillus gorillae TaxID=1243662 RepID=UPI0004ACD415|nr:outer membrane lipoprotein carrier protein LolA [Paenibacillus gorillae]